VLDFGDSVFGLAPKKRRFLRDAMLTFPLEVRHTAIQRVDQFVQISQHRARLP
jgi:hypothetical protein